ncbi:MAG: hypothetical protein LBO65_04690 [Spirochaetaceae bacterium]|nr:hypothetical protein [Spirochaetaceae bacterium]
MKRILPALGLFFMFAVSAPCQEIRPPEWIQGTWYMEYRGELLELIFLPEDILINGESLRGMIEAGDIVDYQEALDSEAYSLRAEYAGGFWWVERFPRPSMTSSYTDQNGLGESLFYLRGEGLSPKNAGTLPEE